MNWFAYRLPGTKEMTTGSSKTLVDGLGHPGFAVVPFDGNRDSIFTIPHNGDTHVFDMPVDSGNPLYPFPEESTDPTDHAGAVMHIKELIHAGELHKCVAARVIVLNKSLDLRATFESLCDAYPDAFVFCFHTEKTGTWIGASPETLLIKKGSELTTMALAGTRPAGTPGEWDLKNIGEQRIVTDFITDTLKQQGLQVLASDPETKAAGPVEHIMTIVSANGGDLASAFDTACALSPTPALAGSPRDLAIKTIEKTESFTRGYYGGFCGPVSDTGDFSFFVNLRSMRAEHDRLCVYAGGGIMSGSDPASEWEESERKARTCIDRLKTTDKTKP